MTQEECLIKYGRILDIHHIDDNDINNTEENMITLCCGCHKKLEPNRKWKLYICILVY